MGRGRPKEIIEHRVTLGSYERERLDSLTMAWGFGRVATPIVNVMSNPWALLSLFGFMEAAGIINIRQWIKDNTPLDEWYSTLSDGLFASYDAAMAALDELEDLKDQLVNLPDTIGDAAEEAVEGVLIGALPGQKETYIGITYRILSIAAWVKTRPAALKDAVVEAGTTTVNAAAGTGGEYMDEILRRGL